jgi:L-malate glycosyltransferase
MRRCWTSPKPWRRSTGCWPGLIAALRLLHLHSSFNPGGKELRAAKLMATLSAPGEHTVVSAVPGALGAAEVVDPALSAAYPQGFPALTGKAAARPLSRIARPWPARSGPDL